MADIIIPQGATNPVTPPAQDLQINLEENEQDKVVPQGGNAPKIETSELDLNLDLNLPEAPKTDDRLKAEDQKNKEGEKPVEIEQKTETAPEEIKLEEVPVAEKAPVIENLFAEMPAIPGEKKVDETPITEVTQKEVTEQSEGIPQGGEAPVIPETPKMEEVPTQEITPSTSIEEILPTPEKKIQEPIIEPETFKEDMKIIDELEGHTSAGGLSPEAIVLPQAAPIETPKTFDLDAMLGPVNAPVQTPVVETVPVVVAEIPVMTMPQNPLDKGGNEEGFTPTPVPPPAFIIPTTQQTPVQAMPQVTIPAHKKTSGVKALLFVVLFAALGFTTYFIVQTMYPVEMGNMFGGGDATQMHASEEVSGDIATTGETQELTGDETEIIETTGDTTETTGTIDGAGNFGELNDLGTPTTTETTEETDLSKLADYVNKGNDLRDQGKALNNNTVIKYGLYISKKATDLLEKIAKGEEITNLSGYLAQFDQYITQLESLIGSAETTTEISSPELPTNETTTTGTEPTPTPTTDPFAAE